MTSTSSQPPALGGLKGLDWEKASGYPDPTRCFSILVIVIIFVRYSEAHDWDWTLTFQRVVSDFYVYTCVANAVVTWLVCPSLKHLPVYDRWSAEWYWWNGWFFHMLLDGMVGSLRLIPVAVHQYDMLDRRFIQGHSVPWTVGMVELLIMNPLCMITYWSITRQHASRFPLELITSTFQLMGMIVFLASEVYEGQLNIPALDPVGVPGNRWANLKLNHYHLTYYWFGFWFCNLVWAVVPYYRIRRALAECQAAMEFKQQNHEISYSNGKRD